MHFLRALKWRLCLNAARPRTWLRVSGGPGVKSARFRAAASEGPADILETAAMEGRMTINRKFFFDWVRAHLYKQGLDQAAVDGHSAILDHWEANMADGDDRWLA